MRIRWKGFELPTRVIVDEGTRSDTYARFIVEPFERGYGITVGNSLRRVLLSSIEGTAPVSLRLENALHEFTAIKGVVEDVVHIALNARGLLIKFDGPGPEILRIDKSGRGPLTAGDLVIGPGVEIVNRDLVLATIEDESVRLKGEIEVRKGRGYLRSEDFPWRQQQDVIGVIPLDAAFSPVRRARWRVEETRVGKRTNYDRLILEIWTNGTINPEQALVEASSILRRHLNPFVKYFELGEELPQAAPLESVAEEAEVGDKALQERLGQPIAVLEPSVRAANCLAAEGIKTLGDLVARTEEEMLQMRNFGKTSLKEIKQKLTALGLSFGMLRAKEESGKTT